MLLREEPEGGVSPAGLCGPARKSPLAENSDLLAHNWSWR
jgi:hypothetical protein